MNAQHTFLSHDVEDRRIDIRDEPRGEHLDAFEDADLELALKSVCWTPRDVHQFLRHRAAR